MIALIALSSSFVSTIDDTSDEAKINKLCHDCRITSQSIEELIRQPRQMDSYGQIKPKLDLDKIKKAVCKNIVDDRERESCREFYFSQQAVLDKWKQSNSRASFFDFVCIKELKLCCPSKSFGPKCSKCSECSLNKHCEGEGTRTGSGSCVCKQGHTGPNCTSCSAGYYFDKSVLKLPDTSSKKILCKPCHRSCEQCRQQGPKGCEVCRKGFTWVPSYGCLDIDECIQSNKKICGENTFCVNTEGSYFCYECDRACDGCHGDGPDMCLRCAKGYKLENGNCAALKKTILKPEANYYRYAIYVGLCLSTCIILHNNVYLASLIGAGVAFYIGASEYMMAGHEANLKGIAESQQQSSSYGHFTL